MAETKLKETIEVGEVELEAGQGSLKERALARYRQHVLDNQERMRDLVEAATDLQRFYSPLGDQWPDDLAKVFKDLNIPQKAINEIWPVVASVTGRETTSRFQPKVTGRDPEDAGLADAYNTTIRAIREGDDYEQKDSAAFRQANIQRLGAVELYPDVWSSKTPILKIRRIPIDHLLIEFDGTEVNYSDRRANGWGRYMNRWNFDERFPDHPEVWPEIVHDQGDADFETLDSHWQTSLDQVIFRQKTRTAFVVDFEWKERQEVFMLELPGEVGMIWQSQPWLPPLSDGGGVRPPGPPLPIDFDEADATLLDQLAQTTVLSERILALMAQQAQQAEQAEPGAPGAPPVPDPQPPIFRNLMNNRQLMQFKTSYLQHSAAPDPTAQSGAPPLARDFTNYYRLKPEVVYYASFVGNKVLRAGKRRDNDWSIFLLCPFFDEQEGHQVPYGLVDLLKNRQELMNMFLTLFIYTMAHMGKATIGIDTQIAPHANVETINAKYADGSKVLDVPGGAKGLFPIPSGSMPTVIDQAWERFMGLVAGGAGQSSYGVGSVENLSRTASRLVDQQLSAMNSTLGENFDALRQHRRATTRKIINFINAYYTLDDFRRVAGPHAKHIPEDPSQLWKAQEFDIVVGEEATTRDMAQAALNSMIETGLWQWVKDIAPEVIPKVAHPIWGSAADELLKKIESMEPQRMVQSLAEAVGIDPGALQSFIDGGGQPAANPDQGAPPP